MNNKKAVLLNQLRKLQGKLEFIHDSLNLKYGSANQLVQETMFAFALCYASVCDVESMFDDAEHRVEMDDE